MLLEVEQEERTFVAEHILKTKCKKEIETLSKDKDSSVWVSTSESYISLYLLRDIELGYKAILETHC